MIIRGIFAIKFVLPVVDIEIFWEQVTRLILMVYLEIAMDVEIFLQINYGWLVGITLWPLYRYVYTCGNW